MQTIFVPDAYCADGTRFVVRADERLTVFMGVEAPSARRTLSFAVALWEQTGRIGCMKYLQTPLVILAALSSSFALADDFKTIAGKEYKDATVTRVEPDGIVVKSKSGISKLYFVELPKDVQRRFSYDPQQASAYSAVQAANYAAIQKQEEEAQRQREEAARQNNPALAGQQSAEHPEQQSNPSVQSEGSARTPQPQHYTTVLHELPHKHTRACASQSGAAPHAPAPSHPKKARPHQ